METDEFIQKTCLSALLSVKGNVWVGNRTTPRRRHTAQTSDGVSLSVRAMARGLWKRDCCLWCTHTLLRVNRFERFLHYFKNGKTCLSQGDNRQMKAKPLSNHFQQLFASTLNISPYIRGHQPLGTIGHHFEFWECFEGNSHKMAAMEEARHNTKLERQPYIYHGK